MSARVKKAPAPRKKKANGYKMPAPIASGEVIHDTIAKKKWRIGPSIGVGGFGEIYSACEDGSTIKPVNYPFVVKIEPYENGPLFVEKNFYLKHANGTDITSFMRSKNLTSLGMPTYFGKGTHEYKGEKYRYLVLERYGKDLWTLFTDNGKVFPPVTVFQIGLQMLDVLEYIHSRSYVHADIKGANILLGLKKGTENQTYLVDFGLATRVNEAEFKPSPKNAHNGTIEYTSRDAHLGVPTMRGDLEILAYNMLQWLVGELPWERSLKQPKTVHAMKDAFMKDVRANITQQYSNVPDALIKFFEYINKLDPKAIPDYSKCRKLFESYLSSQSKSRHAKLEFSSKKGKAAHNGTVSSAADNGNVSSEDDNEDDEEPTKKKKQKPNGLTKGKTGRVRKVKESSIQLETGDSAEIDSDAIETVENRVKRKSLEPRVVVKVKKTRISKATPPAKANHANIATQTSTDRPRRNPRQVSFDSPISEIINSSKNHCAASLPAKSRDLSPDVFDDETEVKVVRPKKKLLSRKLLSDEKVTVKRVVKKTTTTRGKQTSWKDCPAVVNGRPPPK